MVFWLSFSAHPKTEIQAEHQGNPSLCSLNPSPGVGFSLRSLGSAVGDSEIRRGGRVGTERKFECTPFS